MSLNKINSEKRKRNKSPNDLETIRSHISSDEIDNNPVIKNIIKRIKKVKINSLNVQKPNLTPIKDIKDEKQLNFINNINSFHQIIYDYNKKQKVPKKTDDKPYIGQKNYDFSKLYNQVKERNNLEQKEMLEEIKRMYNNNNISLPSIEKSNLFKDNLLLINEKNIKNSIEFKLTTEKSNNNSLSYLKAIQKNINNQILGKDQKIQFPKIKKQLAKDILITRKNLIKKEYNPYSQEPQDYITSIKETINDMDDIDYFFESNNQQYFNYLKDPESIRNSKNSSLNNSNQKSQKTKEKNAYNNLIDIFKLKAKILKNNDCNKDISNKPVPAVNNSNRIDIYNLDSNSYSKKSKFLNKNYSMDNIKSNQINKLIKLKKIYLNGKIQKLNIKKPNTENTKTNEQNTKINEQNTKTNAQNTKTNTQNININIFNSKNEAKEQSPEQCKRLSIKIPSIRSYEKLISLLPNSDVKVSLPMSKRQGHFNQKLNAEKIYEKIKNKDNCLKANNLIKNYLKSKKYNVEENLAPVDICYHYQNIKENIFGNDYFRKYIRLKKLSGYDESTYENIKNEYDNSLNKFNRLADDVNKVISNI